MWIDLLAFAIAFTSPLLSLVGGYFWWEHIKRTREEQQWLGDTCFMSCLPLSVPVLITVEKVVLLLISLLPIGFLTFLCF